MTRKWELYEVSGESLLRKNRFCPRCGDGVFMANHGNRVSCGGCGYTEWKEGKDRIDPPKPVKKEPEEEPKEEAKPEKKEEEKEEGPKKEESKEKKPEGEPAKKSGKKSRKKSK